LKLPPRLVVRASPATLLSLWIWLFGASAAHATEPDKVDAVARCTIRTILAQEKPGAAADKKAAHGVDRRLAFLRRQLGRAPFSAFKAFRLLDAKELVIPQGGRKELALPNGKVMRLTFKERLLGRKDRLNLRMHLSITPPKEKRFLPGTLFTIVNKGTLLVAGDKLKDGTLVVGVTCEARSST
jgi:hypothetical protein